MVVVQAVQLEREEHQRCGEICYIFPTVRHEFGPARVGGQLIIAQASVGHNALRHLIDPLLALDTIQQALGVEGFKFAFVVGGKAFAGRFEPVEVAFEFCCILARVEVVKVPLWGLPKSLLPCSVSVSRAT